MNLTLVFSRKYRWPEHYFSVWSLGNSQKLLKTNQFLVSTIFFTIMNISFFNLRFDLFSIIAKEVNKIRNNVVCVVDRLVFVLLYTHYGPLQYFWTYFCKLKWIGVLRSIFRGYVISCNYFNILSTVCRNDWLTFNCCLPSDQETISFNYSSILFNLLLLEVFHQS